MSRRKNSDCLGRRACLQGSSGWRSTEGLRYGDSATRSEAFGGAALGGGGGYRKPRRANIRRAAIVHGVEHPCCLCEREMRDRAPFSTSFAVPECVSVPHNRVPGDAASDRPSAMLTRICRRSLRFAHDPSGHDRTCLCRTMVRVARDLVSRLSSTMRSRAQLAAENLFLRKQLALYFGTAGKTAPVR